MSEPPRYLSRSSLAASSEELSRSHAELGFIYSRYGIPPLWDRPAGFGTLLHIILEQQVSLASAKACFEKLGAKVGVVTPHAVMELDDQELKLAGFSRQKTAYVRNLAEAVIEKRLDLDRLDKLPDAEVKKELTKLKGVGHWTADIYLLMAMLRPDVMPRGDLALHVAYQKLTNSETRPGSDEFIEIAEKWRPYRSVAARLLWHFYLSERQKPKR